MDEVVVDSSVAIKWFVAEPYFVEAERLLREYHLGSLRLLVPGFFFAEFANIVWRKQRFQGLPLADAERILDDLKAIRFSVSPTSDLYRDAFELAVAHQRTVYDMLYLALSVRNTCRCVTADDKVVNALSGQFPDLVSIAKWP